MSDNNSSRLVHCIVNMQQTKTDDFKRLMFKIFYKHLLTMI